MRVKEGDEEEKEEKQEEVAAASLKIGLDPGDDVKRKT